jgi:Tfp pilus assembly protein PilW
MYTCVPCAISRIRALILDERGISLTEMLIGAGLGIVVLGVPLTLGTEVFIGQNQATSRSAATNRLEVGMALLLRDLRHATAATIDNAGGAATATLTVPARDATGGVSPAPLQVVWTCTPAASCTRKVGTGAAVPQIQWLVSASFAPVSKSGSTAVPQTNPTYVGVTLSVLDSNEQGSDHSKVVPNVKNPIAVTDGVALRNFAS